jgi:predicted lipoprotein with Yx(FWY)xxD motif
MRRNAVLALMLVGVLVAASGAANVFARPYAGSAKSATVQLRKTKLGRILVDSHGRTLYLFEKDKHGRSACSGSCAQVWPPLTTKGKPHAGTGVRSSLLGTTKRSDGSKQVTYHGHPLYRYVTDHKPGETKGQGLRLFGAEWYVLNARGNKIDPS